VALASVFQWTSALCTAGFQSVDLASWSEGARLLLVVAMVLGGAAGSTCGGIKLSRVYLLYKGVVWRFRRIGLSRHEILRRELDGHGIPPQRAVRAVEDAAMLAVAWMVVLLLGTLVLLHHAPPGTPAGSVLLEAASAQGNVGLSSGLTGPEMPAGGKIVLMVLMWAGRLEILPAMVLLVPAITRGRNGPGRG
jgi:trk system potassium uptake protein TrkH